MPHACDGERDRANERVWENVEFNNLAQRDGPEFVCVCSIGCVAVKDALYAVLLYIYYSFDGANLHTKNIDRKYIRPYTFYDAGSMGRSTLTYNSIYTWLEKVFVRVLYYGFMYN